MGQKRRQKGQAKKPDQRPERLVAIADHHQGGPVPQPVEGHHRQGKNAAACAAGAAPGNAFEAGLFLHDLARLGLVAHPGQRRCAVAEGLRQEPALMKGRPRQPAQPCIGVGGGIAGDPVIGKAVQHHPRAIGPGFGPACQIIHQIADMGRGQMNGAIGNLHVLPEKLGPDLHPWCGKRMAAGVGQPCARKIKLATDLDPGKVQLALGAEGDRSLRPQEGIARDPRALQVQGDLAGVMETAAVTGKLAANLGPGKADLAPGGEGQPVRRAQMDRSADPCPLRGQCPDGRGMQRELAADLRRGKADPPRTLNTDQKDRAFDGCALGQKGGKLAARQHKLVKPGAAQGQGLGEMAGAQVGFAQCGHKTKA